jgi:excisionase family DNA binding protein
MTVTEAARRLGVDERTIRHRITRGEMKAERVNPRLYLLSEEEVQRWEGVGKLRAGRKPTRRPPPGED